MEEEKVLVEKSVPKRKKPYKEKKWGDEGFVGKIYYGCYEYKVHFLPEQKVVEYIDQSPAPRTYGAICCDD